MSRKKQNDIFGEIENVRHDSLPPQNKVANGAIKPERFIIVKKFFALHKFLIALLGGVIFIWAFLGQIFLPAEYRFATFMGKRIGDTQAETTRTTLSAEIEKTNAVANESSNVQVYSDCITQLNAQAIGIYNACLSEPNSILAMCEFKRKLTLQQGCEQFKPAPILNQSSHAILQETQPEKGVQP